MSEIQKHTKPNVPNLRFPGFSGEWGLHQLSEFCQKITRKNKGNVISNVLCNSANQGIIPQSEYFDRAIANSDNTAGYYIIEQDDFVYNPRKSTTAPYGPVNIYHGSEPGIISPLYLCFKTTGINREFLYYFFKSKSWWPYMYENGDSGVRHDRVSIKDDVFFSMPIHMPSIKEQDKIANILSLIDQRISIQNKIIEHYRSLISAIIQYSQSNAQRRVFLRDVLVEVNDLNQSGYDVCSVSVSKGVVNQVEYLGRSFAAKETRHYHVVHEGNIVYTKSPTGDFPYGIIKQSWIKHPVAVSPLYGVYRPMSFAIGYYLHFYFCSPQNTQNYLRKLIQKGAKNTINITNQHFLDNSIYLPEDEQLPKIISAIQCLSCIIDTEEAFLLRLVSQKNCLLATMII